ncbi:Cell cycle serine/threonine-protein kinase cdc5/MSD2 [Mortierella sp. GBA30]|nr:Cell cycle serine/threonine-protein kinase cdc5/MSD2 [Mortierella sp. GBA30]
MTTPSATERALSSSVSNHGRANQPQQLQQQQQQQNAFSPTTSLSSSSSRSNTNANTPAGQQQSGIPKSKIGSVSFIPTAAGSVTPTATPGRRLQYQLQLPVSSRLDGPQYMPPPPQPQKQQQQSPVLGTGSGSSRQYSTNSGLPPLPSSTAMGTSSTASIPQPRKQRQRPIHTGYGPGSGRYDSGTGLVRGHNNANPNTNTMGAGGMVTSTATNIHTQMGTTTNAITNTNLQTNTGTTNVDKPKTRKKDKPPRIPPPETIQDNNGKMSYTRGPSLGEGGFASCFMISDQKNDRYAAKVIQKTELQSHKTKQKLFAEIKVHQGMKHINIVKYYHCFEDDDFVYLVLELCESKTLMELIKRRKRLTEPEVRYYMKEIVAGCAYMHDEERVIHRDLKLGNVFLTHDMHCRIGDFGLAAVILSEGERKKTICGTPNYIAPEILFDTENGHSFEVDIWSVGVIMYTLLIGKPPFQTSEVKGIYKKIRDCNYVFPDDVVISEEAKSLVAALLNPRPESRPSMSEVLHDDFFKAGYCPERLDRKALYTAPNFAQEELLWREQQQAQEFEEEQQMHRSQQQLLLSLQNNKTIQNEEAEYGANTNAAVMGTSQHQQLHYDQTSFGDPSEEQLTGRRRSAFDVEQVADSKPKKEATSPIPPMSSQTSATSMRTMPSTRQQQQQQQSRGITGNGNDQRLRYGEQVKMEMLDGDRITSEIRTLNVPRAAAGPTGGRIAPNFAQYTQVHARLQKEDQLRRHPATSSLTANETSASVSVSTFHQQHLQRGIPTATASRTAPLNPHSQPGQLSASRSGTVTPGTLSFANSNRHEPGAGMSASVPSLPASNVTGISSRLPVPKARQSSNIPVNATSSFHAPGVDSQQNASTPTRSGFGFVPQPSSSRTTSSPRPLNAMTMSGSTPNLGSAPKHGPTMHGEIHQRPLSPSPIHRRRSSDMASIPAGSTIAKSMLSRRQDIGNYQQQQQQKLQGLQWTPQRAHDHNAAGTRYEDLMATDIDTDMETDFQGQRDQDIPQHLDVLVDRISDMPPSPFVRRGSGQVQQGRHHVSQNGRLSSTGDTLASVTIIQTVQGVERPASAMQRTFSQERELSEMNRGLESPRKVSRTLHSQPHSHTHSHSLSQSQTPFNPSASLSQPQQQHSFLAHSSQHGLSSPSTQNTLRHHSSQPLPSPSSAHFSHTHSHRASSEWPSGMTGLGLGIAEQENYSGSRAFSVNPSQAQYQQLGHPSLAVQSSQSSHPLRRYSAVDTAAQEADTVDQIGGMVTAAETEENVHMGQDQHQQQIQRSPSQTQAQRSHGEHSDRVEDPYRYQFTNPLQRRNQEAKQQQQLHQQLRSSQHSQPSQANEDVSPLVSSTSSSLYAARVDLASNSVSLSVSGSHSRAHSQAKEDSNLPQLQSQPQSRSSSWSRSHNSQQYQLHQQHHDDVGDTIQDSQGDLRSADVTSADVDNRAGSGELQDHTEESLKEQSSTKEEFEAQRATQNEMRRTAQIQEHGDAIGVNANNAIKQSNETTMAGMSSGGHSDEQDHVEVPSTSCVTTTSLSLISMHHPQQLQDSRKQTEQPKQQVDLNPLDLSMHSQRTPGCREEVERYLRTVIRARQEGTLGLPESGPKTPMPEAPTVFLTRWIMYERYGVGWHLANGVIGVRCNDIITLVLSPNADDIEIIQVPSKRKLNTDHLSSDTAAGTSADGIEATVEVDGWVAQDFYDMWDHDDFLALLDRTYCRMTRYPPRFDKKIRLLGSFRNYMLQMLHGLPPWAFEDVGLSRAMPFLTDFFQSPHVVVRLSNGIVQVNFVDHTKVILSDRGRVLTFIDGEEQPRRLTMTVHQALTPEYFYDPKDEADQNLLIQKELDQIASHQQHRQQQRGNRTKDDLRMTSITEDEMMMTMSSMDDGDVEGSRDIGQRRKMTSMSIDSALPGMERFEFEETRPVFDPKKDHDLVLFPRPKLVARARQEQQRLNNSFQYHTHCQQQQQEQQQSSNVFEVDASQLDLVDISTKDETTVISRLTFKQLHEQIVRRLRLTQHLLQSRRMELAEEQRRERLEREQAIKEGGEDNKARRERRERERAKEKGKRHHSSQEKEQKAKEKKGKAKDKKSTALQLQQQQGNEQQPEQRAFELDGQSPEELASYGLNGNSPQSNSASGFSPMNSSTNVNNIDTASNSNNEGREEQSTKAPRQPQSLMRHASEGGGTVKMRKAAYDMSLKSVQQHFARLQQLEQQSQSPTSSLSSHHNGRRSRSRTDNIKFSSKYSPPSTVATRYNNNNNNNNNSNNASSSFSESDSSSFVSLVFGVPNEPVISLGSSQYRGQGSPPAKRQQQAEDGENAKDENSDENQGRKRLTLQHPDPNSPMPVPASPFDDVLTFGPRLSLSPTP